MVKTILILREDAEADRTAFAAGIREAAVPRLLPFCPAGLKTSVSDIPPPMLRVIPFRKDLIAVVSAEGASDQLVQKGSALKGYASAFRVAEALPVSDEEHWPRNVPAPGIGLLSLFRKKKKLEDDAFILRWFEGHTPLSLKLHPLTNYNRNRVIETIEGSLTSYDGIVEEHVREARDLRLGWSLKLCMVRKCSKLDAKLPLKRFYGKSHPSRQWDHRRMVSRTASSIGFPVPGAASVRNPSLSSQMMTPPRPLFLM